MPGVTMDLRETFANAVAGFNATFIHKTPFSDAELNQVGQYYDDNAVMITMQENEIFGKQKVLDNLANRSPQSFDAGAPTFNITGNTGTVKGTGKFKDNKKVAAVPIQFEFTYLLKAEGWILQVAKSNEPN